MTSDSLLNQLTDPASNARSQTIKISPVDLGKQALLIQGVCMIVCFLSGLVTGLPTALSLGIGGLTAFVPALVFMLIFSRIKADGSEPIGFLRWYFMGEILKVIINVLLLILAFNISALLPWAILAGFLLVLTAGWIGLAIAGLRRYGHGA